MTCCRRCLSYPPLLSCRIAASKTGRQAGRFRRAFGQSEKMRDARAPPRSFGRMSTPMPIPFRSVRSSSRRVPYSATARGLRSIPSKEGQTRRNPASPSTMPTKPANGSAQTTPRSSASLMRMAGCVTRASPRQFCQLPSAPIYSALFRKAARDVSVFAGSPLNELKNCASTPLSATPTATRPPRGR